MGSQKPFERVETLRQQSKSQKAALQGEITFKNMKVVKYEFHSEAV